MKNKDAMGGGVVWVRAQGADPYGRAHVKRQQSGVKDVDITIPPSYRLNGVSFPI